MLPSLRILCDTFLMTGNERLSDNELIRREIEAFFDGKPYRDPSASGGANLVSSRSRVRYGIDPNTGQDLSASDILWVRDESTPDNPTNLVTSRTFYMCRGENQEQLIINFNFDTGHISLAGMAVDLFTGDPKEELLSGLRIITENETPPR